MASESLAPSTSNDSEASCVSMVDVLREEEKLEADATAVLGDSDIHNCTYPASYIPRQALYSCLTCNGQAGVCLACSYECHEGHDLCELYTKRNFRCDCGNDKFPDNKCKLYPTKDPFNAQNIYNQNFKGLYCVCVRPYPDPEDEIEDEMIQCVMCEDWYHGRHLGSKDLPIDYEEMVCTGCMQKFDFLWAYNLYSQDTKTIKSEESTAVVDVGGKRKSSNGPEGGDEKSQETSLPTCKGDAKTNNCDTEPAAKKPKVEKSEDSTQQEAANSCLLKQLLNRDVLDRDCATFWKAGWRSKLCVCPNCMEMYKDRGITFVVDESDTVMAYEKRGQDKQTPSSQYDKGLQALSSMDRVQQVEVIQGFNDMKSELSTYLKKFADDGKVVKEEDIREFFSQMEARKRQRTAAPFQYFCK
ncbi:putative E3 ubiquitin-protein ligase UBR7 [Mizuhopecten yessoensis]|uniref:E3 ubiquitin-protein ligase UBR7 n=1 Tax=Mizuhopecten yessoensis TaxID=6573 RepID=A0A210R2X6_MIZYE|nr:putative E3 ubiquitin-protein ligase UBR7 [Mizuhopecten yessoensis]OWF55413.1 E3 ubiquitin-protein ligase UBR7 [Mizuhopecten yessoensis]